MVEHPPTPPSPTVVNGARYYCATIFDNGHAGTVIGASIIRQREVRAGALPASLHVRTAWPHPRQAHAVVCSACPLRTCARHAPR
eukprot:2893093-Prymnesium_polylepis.1